MLFSVVTCILNQSEIYFRECALSVANQDVKTEWIIVDDGSTAENRQMYKEVLRTVLNTSSVQLIELEKNVGLAQARNIALERSRGDWTVILDSDDRLATGLIKRLDFLSESAAIVCVEANYFSETTAEHRRVNGFERLYARYGRTALDPLLWFDFYYHGIIARSALLRAINGYAPNLRVGEDQDILLRATEAVPKDRFVFLDVVGYEYRVNSSGVCATRWAEVANNYTTTMLDAANRRDANFTGCRFDGPTLLDGAMVDCYSYQEKSGRWLNWEEYRSKLEEASDC